MELSLQTIETLHELLSKLDGEAAFLDTAATTAALQELSEAYDRLVFVVEMVEDGHSWPIQECDSSLEASEFIKLMRQKDEGFIANGSPRRNISYRIVIQDELA